MLWTEVANPWVFARGVFRPETADLRAAFQRLSDWRSRLGVIFVSWLSLPAAGGRFIGRRIIEDPPLSFAAGAFFAAAATTVFWAVAPIDLG